MLQPVDEVRNRQSTATTCIPGETPAGSPSAVIELEGEQNGQPGRQIVGAGAAAYHTSRVSVTILDREMYTEAAAARLLRVAPSTLHWWLEGRPPRYRPVIRVEPTGSRSLTWAEFVEASLLRTCRRDHDVPLKELRDFIDRLRDKYQVPYPLADRRPYVGSGRQLLKTAKADMVKVVPPHAGAASPAPCDAAVNRSVSPGKARPGRCRGARPGIRACDGPVCGPGLSLVRRESPGVMIVSGPGRSRSWRAQRLM
jgi:hypothetical protein